MGLNANPHLRKTNVSSSFYYEKFEMKGDGKVFDELLKQAKEMENQQQQQRMYSEEEAYKIWKAGQEYWKTSGASKTFEEFIEQFKKK